MRDQLERIRNSIQPFAAWHIDGLIAAFDQYRALLDHACSTPRYKGDCEFLIAHLPTIDGHLKRTRETQSAASYSLAATMLGIDIDALLVLFKE